MTTTYKDQLNRALQLSPREKVEALKALAHDVVAKLKTNQLDLNEFDTLNQILNLGIKYKSFNQSLSRSRSLLTAKYLDFLGIGEPKILIKQNGNLQIETGTISAGDPSISYSQPIQDLGAQATLVNIMNEGVRLFFSTGGDGTFPVQLRVVDTSLPVLSLAEYKLVEGSTDTIALRVTSGTIAAGDFLGSELEPQLSISVDPGNYACCAYLFRKNDFQSFYIVCAPTTKPATNQVDQVFTLE